MLREQLEELRREAKAELAVSEWVRECQEEERERVNCNIRSIRSKGKNKMESKEDTESNYFITENPSGVSIRLKSNNRVIHRIVLVPGGGIAPEALEEYNLKFELMGAGKPYPETMIECYSIARVTIADLDKVDSYRQLPKVKLPRYLDALAHHKSLEE